MSANIKKINLIILLLLIKISLVAQDAIISQPQYNLFFTNPAFVGTYNGGRINGFYRQQWLLLESPFAQYGCGYDQSISQYNSGIGIYISNDVHGAFINPSVNIAYSYRFNIKKDVIVSLGLQGGITQKYINNKELKFPNEFENNIAVKEDIKNGFNKIYPDFGFGAVVFYKNLTAGLSANHLTQPFTSSKENKESRLNMKFTGQVGYAIEFQKRTRGGSEHFLMPYLMANVQGTQANIMWGTSMKYDYLLTGAFVRHNFFSNIDALILYVGFEKKQYRFVYSYDMNIGKKSSKILGAHELTFAILFDIKQKKKMKAISCPHFLK